jgi:hypothetical protein
MPSKRISIAQLIMVVALAAVNLAIARATPWEIASFPTIWVVMGILDLLAIWKLILRRSFRAFHYTFLILQLVSFVLMANLVATESFHPLAPFVRWYQQLSDKPANLRSRMVGIIFRGEIWATAFLSFALAWAVGLLAAWLERRHNWDIAAFWRGALLGVLTVVLPATIDDAAHDWVPLKTYSLRWIGRMILLAAGLILGGLLGLSRLKSRTPRTDGQVG